MFSWIVGAFFAAGLAFIVGKVALGLRADYLAIATLLISEIVISSAETGKIIDTVNKNTNIIITTITYVRTKRMCCKRYYRFLSF